MSSNFDQKFANFSLRSDRSLCTVAPRCRDGGGKQGIEGTRGHEQRVQHQPTQVPRRRRGRGRPGGAAPFAARGPAGASNGVGERLVPPGKLGVQQFSIRDSITRLSIAKSRANRRHADPGYLGGPNFPADPTDLGPLVDLPAASETFAFLAGVGYRGFEFFQFSQNVNELGRQPTPAEIRTLPGQRGPCVVRHAHRRASSDESDRGLSAPARRRSTSPPRSATTMIGTAGDPTSSARWPTASTPTARSRRLDRDGPAATQRGRRSLADDGHQDVLHPEQNSWQFFNDPRSRSVPVHRMDWFTANTDPSLVFFEPDILHMYAGRARFPDRSTAACSTPWASRGELAAARRAGTSRTGAGSCRRPAPGVNPFTQTVSRPPTFVPGSAAQADTSTRARARWPRATPSIRTRRSSAGGDLRRHRRQGRPPGHRRERQRPWPGLGSRALAAAREGQRAEPARLPRHGDAAPAEQRGRRGRVRERRDARRLGLPLGGAPGAPPRPGPP